MLGMAQKLTQNQELYCQARARGLSQRRAYRAAYPKCNSTDAAVDAKACNLEKQAKVSARLNELNEAGARDAKLTRGRLLRRLDSLADTAWARVAEDAETGRRIDPAASHALVAASRALLPYAEDDATVRPLFVADFGLLISPDFCRPHRMIARREITDVWLGGGRGSMKSSYASLEVVNYIERNPEQHALVLMKYKTAIRDAAYAQVVWAIKMLGLEDEYEMPDSTLRIKKRSTGQLIIFRGCDNAQKIKSIKVPFGHIGVAWYEEADMFRGLAEIRKVNQSLTRGGNDCIRLYTYNPPRSVHSWINIEMQRRRDAGEPVFVSNYLNAPREWLGDQFITDAEELRRIDLKAYLHEYMGEAVGMGLEVFDPEKVVFREITDEEIAAFDNLKAGQDFGWYPDPWAFTLSEWRQGTRTLLTFAEDGANKLHPGEQAKRIRALLTWRDTPDGDPVYHHIPVRSDDAAPEAIAAQRDAGINAREAGKGNMRDASYRFVQSSTWVIDPVRCPKLAAEVRAMQYAVNKDGEVLNEIPDGNDHWIDAVRYSLMPVVRRARSAYRATPAEE